MGIMEKNMMTITIMGHIGYRIFYLLKGFYMFMGSPTPPLHPRSRFPPCKMDD